MAVRVGMKSLVVEVEVEAMVAAAVAETTRASAGAVESTVKGWVRLSGGRQRLLMPFLCLKGNARPVVGMFTRLVMNNIPLCRLSKQVRSLLSHAQIDI